MEDHEWNRLANSARRWRVRHTCWHSPAVGIQEAQTVDAGRQRENDESRLAGNVAGESTSSPERRCCA